MDDRDLTRALLAIAGLAALVAIAAALTHLKERLAMFSFTNTRLGFAILGVAGLIAIGVAADRTAPIVGANAQIRRLAAQRDDWRHHGFEHEAGRALGWATSFGKSEAQRRGEHRTAVAAVTAVQASCDARVAAARRSALAIQTLVTKENPTDANGCPVRRLIDPRELRDALTPAGPGGG